VAKPRGFLFITPITYILIILIPIFEISFCSFSVTILRRQNVLLILHLACCLFYTIFKQILNPTLLDASPVNALMNDAGEIFPDVP
jgi:hypothetical protein